MKRRNFLTNATFRAIVMTVALGATTVTSTSAVAALTAAQQSAANVLATRIQEAVEAAATSTMKDPGGDQSGVLEVIAKDALFAALNENPDPLVQNMALATAIANMKNSTVLALIPVGPLRDGTFQGGVSRLINAFEDAQHATILHAIEKVVADAGPNASEQEIKALISEQITIAGADPGFVGPALRAIAEGDYSPAAKSAAIGIGHSIGFNLEPSADPTKLAASQPTGSNTGGLSQSQPGGQETTTTTYVP